MKFSGWPEKVVCLCLLWLSGTALANPSVVREIRARNQQAMESYDLLEYEEAQRLLKESIALARKQGVKDPAVAESFLDLAIVLHSGLANVKEARLAMNEAVKIDPSIEIDKAYRTKALSALLIEAKREYGQDRSVQCEEVRGIEHVHIERAAPRTEKSIDARLGPDLDAKDVYVYYRPGTGSEFSRSPLKQSGDCTYSGAIPAEAMQGPVVHYYLQVMNRRGVVIANRGTPESAFIIELNAEAGSDRESEDPFTVEKSAPPAEDATWNRFFFAFAGGSGAGIVTGKTEQNDSDVSCCFGAALLHAMPEVGLALRENLALSAVMRWGFTLGANLPGHAPSAVSGLLRLRYGFSEGLEGFQVIGSVGAGVIRHTIHLTGPTTTGREVDTTASGPFLIGPGAAYWFPVGTGTLKILLESHALIAFSAGINRFMGVKTGFSTQFDLNLGAVLSF
jgi:hypothetical protein